MKRIWLIPVALIVMSVLWTGVAIASSAPEDAAPVLAAYHEEAGDYDGEACEFKLSY